MTPTSAASTKQPASRQEQEDTEEGVDVVDVLAVFDENQSISRTAAEMNMTKYSVRKIVRGYRRHALQDARARGVGDVCDKIERTMDDRFHKAGQAFVADSEVRPPGVSDFQWREIKRGLHPDFSWRVLRTRSGGSRPSQPVYRWSGAELSEDQRTCVAALLDFVHARAETSLLEYTAWRAECRPDLPSATKIVREFEGSWVNAVLTAGLDVEAVTYADIYE